MGRVSDQVRAMEEELARVTAESEAFTTQVSHWICRLLERGRDGLSDSEYREFTDGYLDNVDADAQLEVRPTVTDVLELRMRDTRVGHVLAFTTTEGSVWWVPIKAVKHTDSESKITLTTGQTIRAHPSSPCRVQNIAHPKYRPIGEANPVRDGGDHGSRGNDNRS